MTAITQPITTKSVSTRRIGANGTPPVASNAGRRLLVIDDTPAIHADFRKILLQSQNSSSRLDRDEAALFGGASARRSRIQFTIDSAYQGQEGLALVEQSLRSGPRYEMAFIDMRMPPGWDGIETVSRLWQVDPDLQVVICTAHADYSWEEMADMLEGCDRVVILKKPFDAIEVLQLANALSAKWQLLQQTRRKLDDLDSERKELEAHLRQSQKMEALGQLAGGVAHDFNNLLTVIQGYAQILKMNPSLDNETGDGLGQIGLAAERAANLTRQLLTFSRKRVLQPKPLDLNLVVASIAKMLGRVIGEDIALSFNYSAEPAMIEADEDMLGQVVMNLAVNARDAMPTGGRLAVATEIIVLNEISPRRHEHARPGEFVCLTVSDTGCGIAPEHLARIFEPFFTTKEAGQGTGLGLSTVYGIVNQHRGWVEVTSQVGAGTNFTIFLPRAARSAGDAGGQAADSGSCGGTEAILVVEDEAPVRRLARMMLERLGYSVFESASGVEALEVWEQHKDAIALVLTDVVMPGGVSGCELAERLAAKNPRLKFVYTSGYSPVRGKDISQLQQSVNFLEKPYSPRKLAQTVRGCLDG